MTEMPEKISVMQLTYSLRMGGSEKLAMDISMNLDPARFRPSVCALDLDGDLAQELEREKIDHVVLHRKGLELDIFRRIYRLIRESRIRVIHTHHFTQLFFAALPARWAGARIIHTEHEFFSYLQNPFHRRLIRPLSRFCERMTVVGPEIADYFVGTIGLPEQRVTVVPNGVDIPKFDCGREAARAEFGLSPRDIVIGTVGRLEPEKDQATLLEAFRQIKGESRSLRLLIVGDGSVAGELKAHAERIGISDRTLFLGYRRDIPKLLAAMDVFVLSSIREGLPISLIEAMAARRPVVSSDIGSVKDLVQDGQNGILVSPRDAAAFGKVLQRLVETAELRERLGEAGRRTVEASFSLPVMIRTYEGLYQAALGKRDVRN